MSTLELDSGSRWPPLALLARMAAAPAAIFAATFLIYYLSNSTPLGSPGQPWYQHYIYLAEAMLHGSLDVGSVGMPDFYQDVVTVGDSRYLPFPPGPAIILMPFVAIWGTGFSQIYFAMALGAVNAVLFWYLLGLVDVSRTTRLLMVPFFAFGTAHFYAATTGTTWFIGHVAAVFFLLLALITLFRKMPPVLTALLLGFAFMSREPVMLSAPVFLFWLYRQQHDEIRLENLMQRDTLVRMGSFCVALVPFVVLWFAYNVARFDGLFDTGYATVADGYRNGGIAYAFYLVDFPDAPRFNLFDIRSIPVHLYTIFLMPPQFVPGWDIFRPSPYGMSVLLTSPAFVYAGFVKRKSWLKPSLWIAIAFVATPLLLHYSQGWVQFGYRFLLDFAPFLLLLTAFGFDDNNSPAGRRVQIILVAVAIVAGFWGRYWANQLGW